MNKEFSPAFRFSTLFIGALVFCYAVHGHYKLLSTENEMYKVELIRWERYGPEYGDLRFGLLVREKGTKAERIVTVENLTTGLEEAEIVGRTLVLFGEFRSKASTITLVDLATAKTTDFILHYAASLSPSRRYLVFKAYYPPYGMLQNRSDTVMVYDLSREPSANRLAEASGPVSGQRVGLPVYPPENVDPPSYLVWIPEERQRHYVDAQAGFLWTQDEKTVYFIDTTRNQQLLIRVDLGKGLRRPLITTRIIDAAATLAIGPQQGEPFREADRKNLAVIGMQFAPDGRIRLELNKEMFDRNIYRVTHISVDPPEAPASISEHAEESQ